MTFLPIVERELRVAARRRGTYWSRLIAALLGLALAAWVVLANHGDPPQELGGILFQTLSWLVFLYAMFVGTQVTSDCLSEEKREGTLGLLFLTDLKGYDVVFGKLAATSINAFYGMLAVMPALAIPLLLGGVTNAEFWRVVLVCVNLLLFTLSVGIFASSICRNDHQALALAVLVAVFFFLAPPIIVAIAESRQQHKAWEGLFIFSPGMDCFIVFDDTYKGEKDHFWWNAIITQIYCWTLLFLACRIVPRSWQDATAGGVKLGKWRRFVQFMEGGPAGRRAVRRKLLAINPFLWRAGRSRFKMWQVWFALMLAGGLWAWTHHLFRDDWFDPGRCLAIALGLHLVLKIWFAFESARHLSEDRRDGGMELLLSTPLREKDIVAGQRLALWRQFGGPVLAVLGIDLLFLISGMNHNADRGYWLSMYLVMAIFLVLDLMALSWVGMWLGLSGRKPNRAAILTLMRIILLPSFVFIIGMSCAGVLFSRSINWTSSLVFWCILGAAANAYFTLGAKAKLFGQFRDVVTQRFGGDKNKKTPEATHPPAAPTAAAGSARP